MLKAGGEKSKAQRTKDLNCSRGGNDKSPPPVKQKQDAVPSSALQNQ